MGDTARPVRCVYIRPAAQLTYGCSAVLPLHRQTGLDINYSFDASYFGHSDPSHVYGNFEKLCELASQTFLGSSKFLGSI